jgi:hypothetical protein
MTHLGTQDMVVSHIWALQREVWGYWSLGEELSRGRGEVSLGVDSGQGQSVPGYHPGQS